MISSDHAHTSAFCYGSPQGKIGENSTPKMGATPLNKMYKNPWVIEGAVDSGSDPSFGCVFSKA